MNIGKEPQTSFNESKGVSLLKLHLEKNGLIKCYFTESDKTPNTDGFFVVNNEMYPLKEFHVQIKTTKILRATKDMKVYSCDTKFMNYANLRVTENPCFIFVIELETGTIFFKYLSEKFLTDNNFTHCEQKKVSIQFSGRDILNDIEYFYRLVLDIIKDREIKKFHPANADILEYQLAFDLLNNFFDRDFIKIKQYLYPNIWKFGIAYQRIPFDDLQYQAMVKERADMGIEIASYASSFGVYAIAYGDKQQIFQDVNVWDKDISLKLLDTISNTNGVPATVEESTLNWLNRIFERWITQESMFVQYLPNEALFEIIYNFFDYNMPTIDKIRHAEILITNSIPTVEAKKIITAEYPYKNYANSRIDLLLNAIREIDHRNIGTISRVWTFELDPNNSTRISYYNDINSIIRNNQKFFKNLPQYYNQFITNLFGDKTANKYAYRGKYQVKLAIMQTGNNFESEYSGTCTASEEFSVDVVDSLNYSASRNWQGSLGTSFKGDKTNILTNLLLMVYKRVSEYYNFKRNPSLEHITILH